MTQKNKNTSKNNQSGFNPKSGKNNKKNQKYLYWIYGAVVLAILALQFAVLTGETEYISWHKVKNELLVSDDVEKIVIVTNKNIGRVFIKKESISKYPDAKKSNSIFQSNTPQFVFKYGTLENLELEINTWRENNPTKKDIFDFDKDTEWFRGLGMWLPFIILIVFWIYIMRRMSGAGRGGGPGGIFNVGKSKAKLFDKESKINVSFKDVAGLLEAKQEIEEIVEFLKYPGRYTKLGGKIPKGALLVGPPGTGKTLLAKAVAGEANVPFFSMSGSDFVEMFVGVGASRVRDLFQQAKAKAPCIVFIDEIDAIGGARGRNPNFGANDERENTLNQLLTEMDGFDTNTGVIILAATNRADILDRALLRAGRFDRLIHIELPDLNEREAIFKVHLKPLKLSKSLDISFLAKQTPGFSGADIANVCNEAALIAARKNKKSIEKQDFLDAIDRIVGGLEKKNKLITKTEKETIAYHESGHATVSWMLEHASPLVKVTIVPRGKALGAAWYLPEERQISTEEQMMDEICSVMGGRAAEEIIFGKISTGAQNDLERATKQAYAMIAIFGMSKKLGNISYYDSSGQTNYTFTKPYSEKTAQIIDEEVKKLIESSYVRAKNVLRKNITGFKKLAKLLLDKEVIFSDDLENILGKRKFVKEERMSISANRNTKNDLNKSNSKNTKPSPPKKETDSTKN